MAKGQLRVRIVGDDTDLKRKLKGAGGMIGKFALAAGAAVAGAAVFSVKKFADFDKAMTESLAIMGDVSDAMRKDMSDAAREVAKTTKFSAVEAAESYFFLASAGMDAEQAIAALPRVAKFAQAGNFDMALATDLATDAQSALGLTSDDTAKNLENLNRTMDVFVKANTLANASVEQFATSMTRKAGTALQNVNKDIEEGTAVLAVFADQGIKGERAGTLLANTLNGLTAGARNNAEAFDRLGVKVFDSEGNMRNFADIVGDLEVGLKGMSTEQQLAELAQLGFNKQASEGILALLGNSEALAEYEEALRDAGGTVDEVAEKQLQTFWAQLGLLKDRLIDLALSFGEFLMPALMGFLGWLQEKTPAIEDFIERMLDAFTFLFTGVQQDAPATEAVVGGAFEGIVAKGEVTKTWIENDLIPAFRSIREWWDTSGQEMVAKVTELFQELQDTITFANAVIEGDTSQMWESIKKEFITGEKGVIQNAKNAWGEVTRFWERMRSDSTSSTIRMMMAIRDRWNSFVAWIRQVPDRIKRAFDRLPDQLRRVGSQIVSGLWNGFRDRWNQFTSWLSNLPGAGIVKNLARALGIRSPSRVMAREIGAPIVQGIEQGMRAEFGSLDRLMRRDIPDLLRSADVEARASLDSVTRERIAAAPRLQQAPAQITARLEVAADGDSEVSELLKALLRKGTLRLNVNGDRVRVG
jgi:TP901 family phage tail tape measure protein